MQLSDYVTRNGGFAGINGSYFCLPDYASCQSKINAFDTLAVNGRTHAVLNRANNVYSTVALVTMYGTNLTFYDRTVDWGIQTSGTGALANHPRLLRDGNIAFDEATLEPYIRDGRGPKGFIGTRNGVVVIGHVLGATVPEEAEVLKTLGLQQALNLDGGGSSALWVDGGYKVGPGRQLPTAIVLVK
jgi:exopolysaccharide biosynthesis protein